MMTAFDAILKRLPRQMNRNTVPHLIELAASYIEKKIAKVLKSTLVSAKVDCVSRFSRSFCGLNVQVSFILKNKINSSDTHCSNYCNCL